MMDQSDITFAAEQIRPAELPGQYQVSVDVVTDDIDELDGFDDTHPVYQEYLENDGELTPTKQDELLVHYLKEYARLNQVSVKINNLHGPGGGWPDVTMIGSFSAVYSFWLTYNDLSDSERARDEVRQLVDAR